MVFQKRKKRHGGNLRDSSWQIAKKEEPPESLDDLEPRKTRLQLKLINSATSSKQEEYVVNNVPKRKKGRPSTKTTTPVEEDIGPDPNIKGTIAKSGQVVETLQLLCWSEDLSPAQLEVQQKREQEYNEIMTKLESLAKENNGQHIQKGDSSVQAFQYNTTPATYTPQPPPNGTDFSNPPPLVPTQTSNMVLQTTKGPQGQTGYKLVLDPRLGMVIGTMTPTGQLSTNTNTQMTSPAPTMTTSPSVPPQMRPMMRKRGRPSSVSQQPSFPPPAPPAIAPNTSATSSGLRPGENTAIGGISAGNTIPKVTTATATAVVDLTADDGKPAADSREVAFNKLQGKTFPSLVVVARPHLHAKEAAIANDRPLLDSKVKAVLVHPPTKFTEWLIQQGLVRSEQYCTLHPLNKLNLGMYSDVTKFPYSGGYVWISECCPNRFVSVFSGSLFEGASHTPTVLLKLMYHWACQTNIQNVVQWVKVDNLYVKGLFTWFRAACTYALQKNLKSMGGLGKRIEVGVISLGTTSQDGSQRQVKVEVLGILDPEQRLIRLRAVEPLADGERNYKRRFSKILEPLRSWVHTDSTIATDLTVDKGTLQIMGFTNIIQSTATGVPGNQGVMEYLRKIVPRMFQNTLSLLSRQIIQQFLDELVWREWYGQTASQAFNNLVIHLAEQTRMPSTDTLITRLNKVAANPFKYHVIVQTPLPPPNSIDPTSAVKRYGRKRVAPSGPSYNLDLDKPMPKKQNLTDIIPLTQSQASNESVPLETYYYGTSDGEPFSPLAQKVMLNVRCCVCKVPYGNNIQLLDHLLKHAHNLSAKIAVKQCRYCLASLPTAEELNTHIADVHPVETKSYGVNHPACVICEQRFSSTYVLGKHMSREHVPQELPYQCGTCGFRTSSHRLAIDHFYNLHNGAATVQCPFCLKSFAVWSSGRIMSINVTFFLAHLQKHQKKNLAKKCNKCALWFIQKESLKDHMQKAHLPMLGKKGVRSWPLPANYFMVPKSKQYGAVFDVQSQPSQLMYNQPVSPPEEPFHKLHLVIPKNTECKECSRPIASTDHFPQKLSCSSCRFICDCINTMQMHKIKCRKTPAIPIPNFPLSYNLHCICGYTNNCGNQIAKHLALCERKTAYPTPETAKAAIDNNSHSMLDVLGLVRRNDDVREEIEISSDEEVPNKEDTPTTEEPLVEKNNEKDAPDPITIDLDSIEKDAAVEDDEATKKDAEIENDKDKETEEHLEKDANIEGDAIVSGSKEGEPAAEPETISIASIKETEKESSSNEDKDVSDTAEVASKVPEEPTKSPSPVKELEDEPTVKDVDSSEKTEEIISEKEKSPEKEAEPIEEAMEVDDIAPVVEESTNSKIIPEDEVTKITNDSTAEKDKNVIKSTPNAEETINTDTASKILIVEPTISASEEPETPAESAVEPMECSPIADASATEKIDEIPDPEIEKMVE